MDFDTKVDVLHAAIKARDKFHKELLNIATTETDDEELMTEFDDIVKAHCLDIAVDVIEEETQKLKEKNSDDVSKFGNSLPAQYKEMIQKVLNRKEKSAEEKPDEIDEKKELSGFESMLKFAETENGRKVLVDAYKVFQESQKEQRK